MTWFELARRRFKSRWLGATYCTIETRSTHTLEVTGRMDFMLLCKCSKCGLLASWDPVTGLTC